MLLRVICISMGSWSGDTATSARTGAPPGRTRRPRPERRIGNSCWWLLSGWGCVCDRAHVAGAVDRPDAELRVVLVDVRNSEVGDVSDLLGIRPVRRVAVPPDDLIADDVRLRICVPAQLGVVGRRRDDQPCV